MSHELKILLTQPVWPSSLQWGRYKKGGGNNTFAHGMASIAAVAEKNGFKVCVLDTQVEEHDDKKFMTYLRNGNFDIIGMPCYSASASQVFHTSRLCKNVLPDAKIIIGGVHVTTLPDKTLSECPEIDIIVMGEGEYTFLELLQHFQDGLKHLTEIHGIAFQNNKKIQINSKRPLISDLDELPMPAYHLFPMDKYVFWANSVKKAPTYGIIVARGCPYQCSFCDARRIHGGKLRRKTISRVIEEIRYLQDHHGARGFVFQDSCFTANKKWVHIFCDTLIESNINIDWSCGTRVDRVDGDLLRKMKRAGCWKVYYGLESGNQKSLDLIQKGTTVEQNRQAVALAIKEGLFVEATYIICLPGEDEDDARKTIAFAREMGTHSALFFLPVPFPKTGLWQTCRADGGLRENADWKDYGTVDYSDPVYVNPLIGKEKMVKLVNSAFNTYYFQPKVIARNLATIRSVDEIRRYWHGLRALLKL